LAAVTTALCASPVLLSTPMCSFNPKYRCRPFFVVRGCALSLLTISGSRSLRSFLVELGAPMIVASTIVPAPTFNPCACSTTPTLANSASPNWCLFQAGGETSTAF